MDDLREGVITTGSNNDRYPEQRNVKFNVMDNVVVTLRASADVPFRGRLVNDPWEALGVSWSELHFETGNEAT